MIDRKQLLDDLQSLLKKTIEPDLRERSDLPEIESELKAEFDKAKKAERTALNYTDWRADYITQIGAAWVLTCVFIRFLEDNKLIDPPKLSGPAQSDDGSQSPLQRARDEYDLYIKDNRAHSFREYILSVVDELAKLPGENDIFGDKNIIHQQPNWLSNDAAKVLYNFWQKVEPSTGHVVHDFTDDSEPEMYDTRFLGDLYQDLSEAARKKYALLQTPDFVEEFILDRTLEPALDEFGLTPKSDDSEGVFKMIDPACGSGHFLLGAFPRILRLWQKKEPGTKITKLVQRTLDSIHGVDINPFAIAIARFRLHLAALKACGVERLNDAFDFDLSNLACGDSLYHGRQKQKTLGDWTDESHYFQTEDADNLKRILQEGTFHAVVANPPYIVPKDNAASVAYRELYGSCHRQYSLAVPFLERIFGLAFEEETKALSGFTGQITANSFMTREFGKNLVEEHLPNIDLTQIVDTSGALIPGHNNAKEGTSTVILFGNNRTPTSKTFRVVMGIKGEPGRVEDPEKGLVWCAIVDAIDNLDSESEFVSVADLPRSRFSKHPWTIAGGGISELVEQLSKTGRPLSSLVSHIGRTVGPGDDDAWWLGSDSTAKRKSLSSFYQVLVTGEDVRDFKIDLQQAERILYPYHGAERVVVRELPRSIDRFLWPNRTILRKRTMFGKEIESNGRFWWEYLEHYPERLKSKTSISYGEVATHNHFVLDDGNKVFNRTAPIVILSSAEKENYPAIYGLLNSSCIAFMLRQSCYLKKGKGAVEPWQWRVAQNAGRVKNVRIPEERSISSAKKLGNSSSLQSLVDLLDESSIGIFSERLESKEQEFLAHGKSLIYYQEELDWECYRLYGLTDEDLTFKAEGKSTFGINLGERAFEIVMARKMAAGELQTTWFERHGSTPITEFADHWPDDYKQLVQRRIEVIESNPNIALIEQPEYKRRWNTEPWESQVERALRSWLLDRLESYFDFDGRMNDDNNITAHASLRDPCLMSVAQLADIAAKDEQFHEVAGVYRDRTDFDLVKLVDELVSEEHVPALPILRYKPSGLDKRLEWEKTWELQRAEDAIEARIRQQLDGLLKMGGKKKDKEGVFRKDVPADSPVLEFFSEVTSESTDADAADNDEVVESDGKEETSTSLDNFLTVDEIVRRCVKQEMGEIPVPPKYASKDMISTGGGKYWKLRGKLDVPKERWVSFPHTEGEDQTLAIAWAGYDHLQLLRAIAAYFADVQQTGGSEDPRLVPLLAVMDKQIPWVKQWHNEVDPEFGYALGDYFKSFIEDEARNLGLTVEDVRKWEPPKKVKKKRATKKKATKKKASKKTVANPTGHASEKGN